MSRGKLLSTLKLDTMWFNLLNLWILSVLPRPPPPAIALREGHSSQTRSPARVTVAGILRRRVGLRHQNPVLNATHTQVPRGMKRWSVLPRSRSRKKEATSRTLLLLLTTLTKIPQLTPPTQRAHPGVKSRRSHRWDWLRSAFCIRIRFSLNVMKVHL